VALDTAINADHRVEMFEMILRRIVRYHLDPVFGVSEPRAGGRRSLALSQCGARAAIVLGMLVRVGHTSSSSAQSAFGAAAKVLGVDIGRDIPDANSTQQAFDQSLAALSRLRPDGKRRFLAACEATVTRDGRVTRAEAELYRAIAETLGCPVPPLLAGQRVA